MPDVNALTLARMQHALIFSSEYRAFVGGSIVDYELAVGLITNYLHNGLVGICPY